MKILHYAVLLCISMTKTPPLAKTTSMSNTVQLSAKTVQILANFAAINSSILFKKGNVIKTISNAQNILAKAVADETFPQDFAIYDLSQFHLLLVCLMILC